MDKFFTIENIHQRIIAIVWVALAFFLMARLGMLFAFENTNVTCIWPPSGIALAAFLLFGPKIWPGIFIGEFIANASLFHQNDAGGITSVLLVSIAFGCGDSLSAFISYYLITRFIPSKQLMERVKNVFVFAGIAMIGSLVGSIVGASSLTISGISDVSKFGFLMGTWWIGDSTGVMVFTPFILTLVKTDWKLNWHKISEGVIVFVSQIVLGLFIFGMWQTGYSINGLAALIILPMIWSVFRLGLVETIFSIILTAGVAVWGTIHGIGPFVGASQIESLSQLVIFILVIVFTIYILSITVLDRARITEQFKSVNDHLEQIVETRTSALEHTNSELTKEVEARKQVELDLEKTIENLQSALGNIRTLSGLIPICASCKKIRDDKGYWNSVEKYVHEKTSAELTHSICPECMARLYPEVGKGNTKA